MDCVLRVIKGPDAGREAAVPPGAMVVGRSTSAGLVLTAPEVSWEHLVITRSGEEYMVENLSAHGTVVDGEQIARAQRIGPRVQIRLPGETVLRLEATGPGAKAARIKAMAVLLVLMLLAGVGYFVVSAVMEARSGTADWARAYGFVQPWLDEQTRLRRLAPHTDDVFRDAWRMESMGDYENSRQAWLKVKVLLDSAEEKARLAEASADHPRALDRLLLPRKGDAEPSSDEVAAAAIQFAQRRLAWATLQSKKSSGWLK